MRPDPLCLDEPTAARRLPDTKLFSFMPIHGGALDAGSMSASIIEVFLRSLLSISKSKGLAG